MQESALHWSVSECLLPSCISGCLSTRNSQCVHVLKNRVNICKHRTRFYYLLIDVINIVLCNYNEKKKKTKSKTWAIKKSRIHSIGKGNTLYSRGIILLPNLISLHTLHVSKRMGIPHRRGYSNYMRIKFYRHNKSWIFMSCRARYSQCCYDYYIPDANLWLRLRVLKCLRKYILGTLMSFSLSLFLSFFLHEDPSEFPYQNVVKSLILPT